MSGFKWCSLLEESICLELGGEEGGTLIRIFWGDVMAYSTTFVESEAVIILVCAFGLDVLCSIDDRIIYININSRRKESDRRVASQDIRGICVLLWPLKSVSFHTAHPSQSTHKQCVARKLTNRHISWKPWKWQNAMRNGKLGEKCGGDVCGPFINEAKKTSDVLGQLIYFSKLVM